MNDFLIWKEMKYTVDELALSLCICGSCIDCSETCLEERDYNNQKVIKRKRKKNCSPQIKMIDQ